MCRLDPSFADGDRFLRHLCGGYSFEALLNWIRVAVAIADDPDVHRLADALGCRVAEAVGLVVCTLAKFPEHAPDGNLAAIPATLVERWAGWEGEKGVYDAALRATFLNPQGIWEAWEKHNGKALTKLERDRERLRLQREQKAEELANLAGLSRDGRQPVAGTDGRTDGRTTNGGRPRPWNSEPAPYVPAPFCTKCGEGMGKLHPDDLKLVQLHKEDCPNARVA